MPQYFVVADFAGDFTKVMQAFADVLCQKITADAIFQSVNHADNSSVGIGQRFVVADVRNNHIRAFSLLQIGVFL